MYIYSMSGTVLGADIITISNTGTVFPVSASENETREVVPSRPWAWGCSLLLLEHETPMPLAVFTDIHQWGSVLPVDDFTAFVLSYCWLHCLTTQYCLVLEAADVVVRRLSLSLNLLGAAGVVRACLMWTQSALSDPAKADGFNANHTTLLSLRLV